METGPVKMSKGIADVFLDKSLPALAIFSVAAVLALALALISPARDAWFQWVALVSQQCCRQHRGMVI